MSRCTYSRAGLALAFLCAAMPSAATAMGLGWGCSASQPPAVTVQLDAAAALVGDTVNISASAVSQGASVTSFVAVISAGQGTLTGGATLDDGSMQFPFATGSLTVSGSASWVLPATPGTYTVTVTARNCAAGSGSATASVTVSAQPVLLPVVDSLTSSADSVLAGKSATLTASAHDPGGAEVTY